MSCQRNCFTVWPLVFQTSALVKDLHWADEGWEGGRRMRGFLLACAWGWRRQDKYVRPLMVCVAPVSFVTLSRVLKCTSLPQFKISIRVNWIVWYIKCTGICLGDRGTARAAHTDTLGSRRTGHDTQHRHSARRYTHYTIFISWHVILNLVFSFSPDKISRMKND